MNVKQIISSNNRQWKTNMVISVRGGNTRVPHSISLDLVLRSINARSMHFNVFICSFTSAPYCPAEENPVKLCIKLSPQPVKN